MFLKLRMLASHLLAAQDVIKCLASGTLMTELHRLVEGGRQQDDPTQIIVTLLDALTSGTIPSESIQFPEKQLTPVSEGLIGQIQNVYGQSTPQWSVGRAAKANELPQLRFSSEACITTSCMHVFCEECLLLLREGAESSGLKSPLCPICEVEIEYSARCSSIENLLADISSSLIPQPRQAK